MNKEQKEAIKNVSGIIKKFNNDDGAKRVVIALEHKDGKMECVAMMDNVSTIFSMDLILHAVLSSSLKDFKDKQKFEETIKTMRDKMPKEIQGSIDKMIGSTTDKTLKKAKISLITDLLKKQYE